MERTINYLRSIAKKGQCHFDTNSFRKELSLTQMAANAALRRLREKNLIATPYQGFHIILEPQHEKLGCRPPDEFIHQLMTHLKESYYVALLSAAEIYGAAHQRPQVFQVMLKDNRRDIICGSVRIKFYARKNLTRVLTRKSNTRTGQVLVASPEATAMDLICHSFQAGGINNVATVLSELKEELNSVELVKAARLCAIYWSQRLGYLLDLVGASSKTEPLAKYVRQTAIRSIPLVPKILKKTYERNKKWKVKVNYEVEPD